MNRKLIIMIAIAAAVVIVAGGLALALSGKGEKKDADIPRIDTFPDQSYTLETDGPVMVNDGQTLFWPIANNGSGVMLVYSVSAFITWSDDEEPPVWRVTYVNEPDIFTAIIDLNSSVVNVNSSTTATSSTGTLTVTMNMQANPGVVLGNGQPNWTFPASGQTDLGQNDSLYLSIGCVAGHIRSTMPGHIIMYTDRGDEVEILLTIKYKIIPQEVFEYWFIGKGKGM